MKFLINNGIYDFKGEPQVEELLKTDDEYAATFIKEVFNSDSSIPYQRIVTDVEEADEEEPLEMRIIQAHKSSKNAKFSEKVRGTQGKVSLQDKENILLAESSCHVDKWTYAATDLLITTRLSMEEIFKSGVKAKKTLWNRVANEMLKEGYSFTGKDCDIKFKGILMTYKRNVQKKNSTGESKIVWPFFEKMDEVYGTRANINPPKDRLLSSSSATSSTNSTSDDGQLGLQRCKTTPRKTTTQKLDPETFLKTRTEEEDEQRKFENAILQKRIKLLEEKNELQARKVKAAEEKNAILKELLNVLKNK